MKRYIVAEAQIGDEIDTGGAASVLANQGTKWTNEQGKTFLKSTASYALHGPNVGKEMLFEWNEERGVYVRIE